MSPRHWGFAKPPETFEEACTVREEILELTYRALVETDFEQIAQVVQLLKQRLDLLPLVRVHFEAEAKKRIYECKPILIPVEQFEAFMQTKRREPI